MKLQARLLSSQGLGVLDTEFETDNSAINFGAPRYVSYKGNIYACNGHIVKEGRLVLRYSEINLFTIQEETASVNDGKYTGSL